MTELPEAITMAKQLNDTVAGRTITRVEAGRTPHGFAFFSLPTEEYPGVLEGRALGEADAHGMFMWLPVGENALLLGDGIRVRWYENAAEAPQKHQLYLELDDGGALVCSVQMYGGMWACPSGACENTYWQVAQEKPSPLSDAFDAAYFDALVAGAKPTLSAKAFLATEQRIPGLGNGVLQDMLFTARIHPKAKLQALSDAQLEAMFSEVKGLMREMTEKGGRDTEKDIFGNAGGYQTILSAKTAKAPCPVCGGPITKQAYLGGSVYYCPICQPV